jgi:hypothetical protein
MLRHLLTLAARIFPSVAGKVLYANYIGRHGCLNTAMSFVTWNRHRTKRDILGCCRFD